MGSEGVTGGSCYEWRRRDGVSAGVLVEEKKKKMEWRGRNSDEDSLSTAPGSWLYPRHA